MRTTSTRLARSLGSLIVRLLVIGTGCAVAGAIVVLFILPRLTGGSALTVLTGSMTPGIPVGSLAFIRPVDPATLRVGDVATYQRESGVASYVTHRVVGIDPSTNPEAFTFKGDANRGPDEDPVPGTAIRGQLWFHVPYLGSIRDALHGKAGLSLLAMFTLGGYALLQVASELRASRRRRRVHGRRHDAACEKALVIAHLPRTGALPIRDGMLLRQDDSESVLVYSIDPAGVAELMHQLQGFSPHSVEVLRAGDSLLLTAVSADSTDSRLREAEHAST
jgi:signal peptidase I